MTYYDFCDYITEIRDDLRLNLITSEIATQLEDEVKSQYPNWTYGFNPNINPEMF